MPADTLGEIRCFSFATIPDGWALCDGAILGISTNQALYSVLRNRYGGDGRRTFALPDMRGRVPRHSVPLNRAEETAAVGGTENEILDEKQLPQHSHPFRVTANEGREASVQGAYYAAVKGKVVNMYAKPDVPVLMEASCILKAGSGLPHTNMQPFAVVNYCICIDGELPVRGD